MEITLIRPDDWHVHLRDGDLLTLAAKHTARQFGRAIVMPNLDPPVVTTEQALAYRDRILAVLPDPDFSPLMTLYLTEQTTPDEIRQAKNSGHIYGIKLYPAGATTHADAGVQDLSAVDKVLAAMETFGLPLLVHGEVTDPSVDIFDREAVFIERHLVPIVWRFPELKIVLEHVTSREGMEFVRDSDGPVAGTITAHHILMNRNALFADGLNPHHYCLPVLKRESHRQALIEAATSGNKRFFLGTDSAPHLRHTKESACGCAGIYSAHAALELYAEAFEAANALDQLESFASINGPDFYGLPHNSGTITLRKEPQTIPETFSAGDDFVVPLRAGGVIGWRLQ
ncbi:MAG: dihydroorotase [Gammaproteobacteria bacterium]